MTASGEEIRRFYDGVYHRNGGERFGVSRHLRRLAAHFEPWQGKKLLDVGCGQGEWLRSASDLGAMVTGIDISQVALNVCRQNVSTAQLYCTAAEQLPFNDQQFDVISCLGALEHFLDPETALREMVRVAKLNGLFLLLVPNADFLLRRMGLYSGTQQTDVREDVRSLAKWRDLFDSAGLTLVHRWSDLHILSASWIFRGSWREWPLRATQALALPFWPLSWQYQVYHLCVIRKH